MKKLFILLLVSGFFFFGCSEKSSVVNPVDDNSRTLIQLPQSSNSLQKTYEFEEEIKGSHGGSIPFWVNNQRNDDAYSITGILVIPRKAFNGKEEITINISDENTSVDFGPSPFSFNKDLFFTIIYTGLELFPGDEQNIKFGYLNSNTAEGFEEVPYDKLVVNINDGTLAVYGARISHFSRYGFTR